MEIRQLIRILVFGYFSFLPNLLSYWIAAILPQVIVDNLGVTHKQDISKVGGLFFSTYFFGIIGGAISWPYILKVISKKQCLLLGLFFQGVFTALTGMTTMLWLVYTYRFWTGFFNNINTVGKDFIFEFAKPHFRQYAFSMKSCFTVGGIFIGPLFGYYIYMHYNCSLEKSMVFLFYLYLFACLLFIVVFILDMSESVEESGNVLIKEESEHGIIKSELVEVKSLLMEEEELLIQENIKEDQKQKGIPEVLGMMWRNKVLRDFSIVYFLTNGIFTTRNFILVFYLEASWDDQGLGIPAVSVSYINFYSFFFCLAFLLVSPYFVPSKISYLSIVRDIIIISLILVLLPPILRDVLPNSTDSINKYIIYSTYGLSNFFNPKLFSPFINYFMNDQVDKYSRTALNSITFITSCLSACVIMMLVSPMLSISLHNEWFVAHQPWNKYVCFVMLDILLAVNLFYLRSRKDLMSHV